VSELIRPNIQVPGGKAVKKLAKDAADMEKIAAGSLVLYIATDKETGAPTLCTGTRDKTLQVPVDGGAPPVVTNSILASAPVLHCFAAVMGFRKGSNRTDCVESGIAWFRLRQSGSATPKSSFWCHGMCTCTPEVTESDKERWDLAKKALPMTGNRKRRVQCETHPAVST
jgi:hypothetical protein